MDPITIAGLGLGGIQALAGIFTNKGPRPQWQIPGAAYEQVATARQMASATERPGNQYAVDQIAKNASSAVGATNRTAGSGTAALAAAGNVNAQANNALQKNSVLNSQYSYNAKQNLQNVLGNFAQYQRESFIKNVWDPYYEKVQTKNALIGSGLQNIFGSLNTAANMKMFAGMYGGGSSSLTPTQKLGASVGWDN